MSEKQTNDTAYSLTRRNFFRMAVGSLTVLPVVAGGFLVETPKAYADKKATPVESGSEYYVKVPGVKSTQWDDAKVVTVTKGSESYSVTFDAMAYAQSKAGSSKKSLANLAKSMHNHHQAAISA